MESVHSILVGEVNLALVTAPARCPDHRCAVCSGSASRGTSRGPPAAHKESPLLQDPAKDEWILHPKRFDPVVFDAIMDAAQSGSIAPKHAHDVIAPDGVVVKPLSDASLCFNTCVIRRADNSSRLIEEYVRLFLRRYSSQHLAPKQVKLSLSA